MKLNARIVLLAGMTLAPALYGAETVFQGFGKSWAFYSGTTFSEKKDAASMPLKPGGMSIGVRQDLKPGVYVCSFEYKFAEKPSAKTQFQFGYNGKPELFLNLLPETTWSNVRFRVANTKGGSVKFGFWIQVASENRLELRNFKIERLSDEDFRTISYPNRTDCWFNRSRDRKNSGIVRKKAEDHVLGGEMISLEAAPSFQKEGTLCLMTLSEPLPKGKKFRLSCDLKSDRTGPVRIAVSDCYRTEQIGAEWKKIVFEFQRSLSAGDLTNVSFQKLNREIRSLSVKDLKLEMVD